MQKLKSIGSIFEKIPSPMIWEILSRLPTKACLNCKLVCKDWYSIIISHEFRSFRSARRSLFTILLYGKFYNKQNFLLLDLDKSSNIDEMSNLNVSPDSMILFKPKFTIRHYKLSVINECNGLVCLKSYGMWQPFIICNLLTGQQKKVNQVHKKFYSVEIYGFGCCPVSSQFKLVRILLDQRSSKAKAQVCIIPTNEWRTVGDAPRCHFSNSDTTAFLHGSLHRFSDADDCIWSFQFENEQFIRIPIPNVKMFERQNGGVNVYDSCLTLSCISEDRLHSEVWVMKEYGMKDSWMKLFVIDTQWFSIRMPLFQMNDKRVLVSYASRFGLGLSDIESGKCERLRVFCVSNFKVSAPCNAMFSKFLKV